jgi:hypothetical protein
VEDKKNADTHVQSDSLESHPEFQDQMEEMNADFFEKNDPEFALLMKKFNANKKAD